MSKKISTTKSLNNNSFVLFNPKLGEEEYMFFLNTAKAVKNALPEQRLDIINPALQQFMNDESIEKIKLTSTLSIFKDLIAQEWRVKIHENKVYLAPSTLVNTDNKLYLRQQLQIERNKQLEKDSTSKFVEKMERIKLYKDREISIKNLIGSAEMIREKNQNHISATDIIKPYIQLVDKSRCTLTGYKLSEIWRYFRYTWSIPYKSTPGRNIFYLIRDAAQPYHPIIGISALGNSVLQLTHRDNFIGWTLESIKRKLEPLNYNTVTVENVKGSGLTRKSHKTILFEEEIDFYERIHQYSVATLNQALANINSSLEEIYSKDLLNKDELVQPQLSTIVKLEFILDEVKNSQLNNKLASITDGIMQDTLSPLYVKKRANELIKLLQAKIDILMFMQEYADPAICLKKLSTYKSGRALNIALQANRKTKIGSNIMEIIVCGSIPPYNELLGGKLVAMLMTSPTVISDYTKRYSQQVSEIASRMRGKAVIRDSKLAFLGTTSLYHSGSSQYNRIKIPARNGEITYKYLGETEGFSSIFFSEKTSSLLSKLMIKIDGGRKINNVFGEGTSPRMRLMRSGISALGLSDNFIRTHTRRIIYGIELASNTKDFLNGYTNHLNYYYPVDEDNEKYTSEIIEFWAKRWLSIRLNNPIIMDRLNSFNSDKVLVSKYLNSKGE